MSDSLRPHGLYSPWNSPGQNTGVRSLSLLQGIFPTQGSNPGLPHCRPILYQLSHQGSPRILEWVAYPFSSGSSWPGNWTRISCIVGLFFTKGKAKTALSPVLGWEGPLTWAGLCVAERLLRVQSQADVTSVGGGWVCARAGPHVVSTSTRRRARGPGGPARPHAVHWEGAQNHSTSETHIWLSRRGYPGSAPQARAGHTTDHHTRAGGVFHIPPQLPQLLSVLPGNGSKHVTCKHKGDRGTQACL